MKIHIITVGKPHLSFAKEGFEEYTKRLERFHKVAITHIKDDQKAGKDMLNHMTKGYNIVLDEKGQEFTSRQLSVFLDEKALYGDGSVNICIGGPDGHADDVRRKADIVWSLSKLTFPHDIAMFLVAETLYRAATISAGHPYHRE